MNGFLFVCSVLSVAADAGFIPQDTTDGAFHYVYDTNIPPKYYEDEPTCDLIIRQSGRVIDHVATVFGDDFVSITCDARCKGPGSTPALAWYRDPSNTPIPSTMGRLSSYSRSSDREQRLIFTHFREKDAGSYTCKGWLGPMIGWVEKSIELQIGCLHPKISCDVNQCLPPEYKCDGIRQCYDGSDEYDCGASVCHEREFYCDGRCHSSTERCNGQHDCFDGMDELDCEQVASETSPTPTQSSTPPETFEYYTTEESFTVTPTIKPAIESSNPDITAGETKCLKSTAGLLSNFIAKSSIAESTLPSTPATTMKETLHATTTGTPDKETTECDDCGYEVTTDSTATIPFYDHCGEDLFQCLSGRCIPLSFECDGVDDCPEGEDEWCWGPTTDCNSEYQFDCWDSTPRKCIPLPWVCDGRKDCPQNEDELNCFTTTTTKTTTGQGAVGCNPEHEYRCRNGHCIPLIWVCDDFDDCPYGEDELYCTETIETASYSTSGLLSTSSGTTNSVSAASETSRTITQSSTTEGAFTATPTSKDTTEPRSPDTTTGKTKSFESTVSETTITFSTVETSPSPATSFRTTNNLPEQEYQCLDGSCISLDWLCDGTSHCLHSEDELNCTETTETASYSTPGLHSTFTGTSYFLSVATETSPTTTQSSKPSETSDYYTTEGSFTVTPTIKPTFESSSPDITVGETKRLKSTPDILSTFTANALTVESTLPSTPATTTKKATHATTTGTQVCQGMFTCGDGTCIALTRMCDNIPDCKDDTDEKNCAGAHKSCAEQQTACKDGKQCINLSQWGDGKCDCTDGSNDIECG